jgi:hypothetical protein
VKKFISAVIFSLLSVRLFASGHGLEAVGTAIEFMICGFIFLAAFITLTALTAVNRSNPRRTRTDVYLTLLIILSGIYLCLFIKFETMAVKNGGGAGVIFLLPNLVFIMMIVLNSVFIVTAKKKLKQSLPHW